MSRPFPHRWTAYSIGRCRHYAQQLTPSGETPVQAIGNRGKPLTAQDVRAVAAAAPQNGVIVTTDPSAAAISPEDIGRCWLIVWDFQTATVIQGSRAT